MLSIFGRKQSVCNGMTRREVLQAGGAGLLGLHLNQLFAAEEYGGAKFGPARAKSVLFVYLFGGPSQLESFDMKPDAPSTIRGPFQPIASRTPGLRISEHLPKLASCSNKFCVVRSMTHPHNDHNACHYIQTGHKWTRTAASGSDVNASETDWPSMGSIVEYVSQHSDAERRRPLPYYVYLPNRLGHLQGYDRTGQYAGWLGSAYNGLATDIRKKNASDNPYFRDCSDKELDFRVKGLAPLDRIALDRMNGRLSLLDQFETARAELDRSDFADYERIRERAADIVASPQIRDSLDIRRETSRLRDQYGRHLFGQSLLMGRRMIEAGCRFVTVAWDAPDGYSWDSHRSSNHLQQYLLPGFDQAFAALLEDMDQRGLLDETLVVALGEMGRTPKGTSAWGRGHWSYCFPALLAGAGIRGGLLYGRSDEHAAYPKDDPTSPEDLAATIYQSLGIDPQLKVPNLQGVPTSIVDGGRPLDELFG